MSRGRFGCGADFSDYQVDESGRNQWPLATTLFVTSGSN